MKLRKLKISAAAFGAVTLLASHMQAQQIYLQTFNTDDSANWAKNFSYTGGADFNNISNTLWNFNFDYTTLGIPLAPHSTQFGSDAIHHGLKISAVYTNPATAKGGNVVAGMSLAPTNFSITANFVMHADMWVNVNCTPYSATNASGVYTNGPATSAHNSTASTVFYGCGYGTTGNASTVPGGCDAIMVGTLTDNGSSASYRMYGPSIQAAYQDGAYQSTGTTTPGFPGDPFVYNSTGGSRGAYINTAPWNAIFPASPVPDAQTNLYPQQMHNQSMPGTIDFKWHDVSVEKIGNVIVYKMDGNIVATANYSSAGTPPGSFLTFFASRTTLSVANAITGNNYTNLNFAVFANVVVSNYNNIVNVSAPTPSADEATPGTPGVFTISRSSAGVPLTVTYTLTGTATNGTQYTTLPTSVTFASTATDTNIYVTPINDGVPNPTTTVILTLQSGVGYQAAGAAVVNILDANTPTVDIVGTNQAYGRYTGTSQPGNNSDFLSYTVTRRGKLTTGSDLNVNLSYGGAAVGGTDYTTVSTITIPDGAQSAILTITPQDNAAISTNRTLTVSAAAGSGYTVGNGPAIGTIVSAHYPVSPVLLTDDLTDATRSTNWAITYGCGDPDGFSTDYTVDFGYTLASATVGVPPGGNPTAMHLTCNKLTPAPGAPGAVNAYFTNLFLTGDYAVRFNMNIVEGQTTANSTEFAVFGINHSGTYSNWWYLSGVLTNQTWSSDGVWYHVTAQPGGASSQGDFAEYTGLGGVNNNSGFTRLATRAASSFSTAFKVNPGPFTCFDAAGGGSQTAGVPANGSPALGYDASTWSDVEIKQQHNAAGQVVNTLSINHTSIFTYTNTTVWTNGYLMLGYADPAGNSVGNPEAGVYYANLQVVDLTPPTVTINNITISGGNVLVTFTTSSASDTTSSFTLVNAGTVNGSYASVGSTITSLGSNQFRASTPYLGGSQVFYRVQHN